MVKTKKERKNANRNKQELRNQQGMAKKLDVVADRTISNQRSAKAAQSYGDLARKPILGPKEHPHPHALLSAEEADYHGCFQSQESIPKPLINHNIERSDHTQPYVSMHKVNAAGTFIQCNVLSATDTGIDSDTPKGFWTKNILNVNGVGSSGVPGPAFNNASVPSAAVIYGTSVSSGVIMDTSQADGGGMTIAGSAVPCPFVADVSSASSFRWQLTKIELKVLNRTKGSDRGGVLYVMQPINKQTDLQGTRPDPTVLATRGLFKTFQDCETKGKGTKDGWLTLSVRNSLSAYYGAGTGTYTHLDTAALTVYADCTGSVAQNLEFEFRLSWSFAGTRMAGLAETYAPSVEAANQAATANEVMRRANIMPSDQTGKEHVPAALSLSGSPALQGMVSMAKDAGHLLDASKPAVMSTLRHFAGKHLKALATAGIPALAHAVEAAA